MTLPPYFEVEDGEYFGGGGGIDVGAGVGVDVEIGIYGGGAGRPGSLQIKEAIPLPDG